MAVSSFPVLSSLGARSNISVLDRDCSLFSLNIPLVNICSRPSTHLSSSTIVCSYSEFLLWIVVEMEKRFCCILYFAVIELSIVCWFQNLRIPLVSGGRSYWSSMDLILTSFCLNLLLMLVLPLSDGWSLSFLFKHEYFGDEWLTLYYYLLLELCNCTILASEMSVCIFGNA